MKDGINEYLLCIFATRAHNLISGIALRSQIRFAPSNGKLLDMQQ